MDHKDPGDLVDPAVDEPTPAEVAPGDASHVDPAPPEQVLTGITDVHLPEHVEPDPHENPADAFAKAQAIEDAKPKCGNADLID